MSVTYAAQIAPAVAVSTVFPALSNTVKALDPMLLNAALYPTDTWLAGGSENVSELAVKLMSFKAATTLLLAADSIGHTEVMLVEAV